MRRNSADRRGGQKVRYLSLGIVLVLIATASLYYFGFYTRRSVAVVAISYNGFTMPLTQEQSEFVNQLKGVRYRDIQMEQAKLVFTEHPMITDAGFTLDEKNTLIITLEMRVPLVHVRFSEQGFYRTPGGELVSDVLVTADDQVIRASSDILAAVKSAVPTIEARSREDLVPDGERIDTQLLGFVRMLNELHALNESQYAQLNNLFFNAQDSRELIFSMHTEAVRLSCIMIEPMTGGYFSDVLRTAVTAAGVSGSQQLLRLTLLKDHAVLLSSN
jgi:hypothetical protein